MVMADIKQKEELITPTKNNRSKRGLFNAVGTLSKTLFGTLNEDDAREYDNKITNLRNNEEYLLELLKNHTSILETTTNIFNKSRTDIKNQFTHIENKIDRLKSTVNLMSTELTTQQITIELETLVSLITLMLLRHQTTINTLVDLMTDVKHGKPNPAIITPAQVKNILTNIQKNLPNTLTLPVNIYDDNLIKWYQISHTSMAIIQNRIIFELKIPLPFKDAYQLFKVIPLPTIHESQYVYIQPSLEYLVIDYTREHYYPLNKFDLSHCLTSDHDHYLCLIIHPIFNIRSANNLCEIELLQHSSKIPPDCEIRAVPKSNYWIQLSQPNYWLFALEKSTTLDIICKETVSPLQIEGSGIVHIEQGCYLRADDFTLQSHNMKTSQLKASYLPALNLTYHMPSIPHLNITDKTETKTNTRVIKYHSNDDLKEISVALSDLKTNENKGFPKVDKHDVHHYTISYFMLTILIIIIIIAIKHKFKFRQSSHSKGKNKIVKNDPKPSTAGTSDYQLSLSTEPRKN